MRRLCNKVRDAQPSLIPEMAQRIAQTFLNDTMGPNGIVPTLLVYGMRRRFPVADSDFAYQQARMRTLAVARRDMETIFAQLRITRALRARIPAASKLHHQTR